ncbi:MAG: hypothetical protein AAGB02_03205 [Pseudomonadota bacterium]
MIQWFFDVFTILGALMSIISGVWILSQDWAMRKIRVIDAKHGNVVAQCHITGCVSTALSIWHFGLMTYWSLVDGEEKLGGIVNASFELWHICIAALVVWLHIFLNETAKACLKNDYSV